MVTSSNQRPAARVLFTFAAHRVRFWLSAGHIVWVRLLSPAQVTARTLLAAEATVETRRSCNVYGAQHIRAEVPFLGLFQGAGCWDSFSADSQSHAYSKPHIAAGPPDRH